MPSASSPAHVTSHNGRVHVRPATPDDMDSLVAMWEQLRTGGSRSSRDTTHVTPQDTAERLSEVLADPTMRVVVATYDGEIEGMAILSTLPLGPLSTEPAVHISHVVIEGGHRRRGVGRALVAAAAAYAEEVGAEHVSVSVYPGLREANRFYARLGFSPFVVRRLATTATLKRRLALSEHPVAVSDEITRRRIVGPRLRQARRRSISGGR